MRNSVATVHTVQPVAIRNIKEERMKIKRPDLNESGTAAISDIAEAIVYLADVLLYISGEEK